MKGHIVPFDATDLSRRTVLAGLGGIGLGGALLLSGCEAAVHHDSGDPGGSGSKPAPGGTLHAGIPDDLIPANMFTNTTTAITALIGLVYESLIRFPNDRLEPQPRLATSWHVSDDGLSVTLDLRDDVVFHTGRPFTSKDVEFSIKTYADDKWNAQEKGTAQVVTKFDTSQPHRVVLYLDHPVSNILDLLDTVYMIDQDSFTDFQAGKRFVGTGPFAFHSWTPNSNLQFTKNTKYWQHGRPYLDGVRLDIVPDVTSLTAQLKSGQVDFAEGLNYRDAAKFATTSGFTTMTLSGAEQQIYVGANLDVAPLNDVRVRQAIAYALDRERILSEVFDGSGYPVNLPWPKYSPAYDEARNKRYAYDPKKAKALIAEVGKIPTITYTYNTAFPFYGATAQIVQSNLADVGINVELDPVDPAQFVKLLIGAQFKGLWTTFHSWAQWTPSTLTVSAYPFNAAHNASHYSSDKYTADAQSSWKRPSNTGSAAVESYDRLSDDLLAALFLIEIGVVEYRWVHSTRLSGVSYTKRWELDLTNAYLS